MSDSQLEEEFRQSLVRAFKDQDLKTTWIRMDGQNAQNKYLMDGWNYAVDKGWIVTETVELEQETFIKGYLTDKGKAEVLDA